MNQKTSAEKLVKVSVSRDYFAPLAPPGTQAAESSEKLQTCFRAPFTAAAESPPGKALVTPGELEKHSKVGLGDAEARRTDRSPTWERPVRRVAGGHGG